MPPVTPVFLLLGLLAAAPPSPAARKEAREHARKATIAYNLGNYDEAAAEYEAAYRLVQDPTLLYNVGQAYRLAGRADKALAAYKGFLRTAPPGDPVRGTVEGRVAELERAMAERRTTPPAPEPPPPAPPPPAPPPATGPPLPSTHPPGAERPVDVTVYEPPPAPASPVIPPGLRTGAGAHVG